MDDESAQRARRERLHLLDALLVGIERRDELVRIAGDAEDADAARDAVARSFGLDATSAQVLMDVQIRRLTRRGREKIRAERADLVALIDAGN